MFYKIYNNQLKIIINEDEFLKNEYFIEQILYNGTATIIINDKIEILHIDIYNLSIVNNNLVVEFEGEIITYDKDLNQLWFKSFYI